MQLNSFRYVLGFAAAVCGVCSIFVSSAAVLLKERQEENKLLDRQSKVLAVAGLQRPGEELSAEEIGARFRDNIKPVVVELATGSVATDIDAREYDQRAASSDPEMSNPAPQNSSGIARLPKYALVYQLEKQGAIDALILPVEGKGLWSTLYGYLALEGDLDTIRGITFYEHGETPGLGGEVDNPRWRALWPGRKAYGADGEPKIAVSKGRAGSTQDDPYNVDGLSGATLTSRGVTNLVRFWLGESGLGKYVDQLKGEA